MSCRWYKWLPPTCFIQRRVLPSGTILGKHQTHHMLLFTQHLHSDISVKPFILPWLCSLREFLFMQIPNSSFLTSCHYICSKVPQNGLHSLQKCIPPKYVFIFSFSATLVKDFCLIDHVVTSRLPPVNTVVHYLQAKCFIQVSFPPSVRFSSHSDFLVVKHPPINSLHVAGGVKLVDVSRAHN